MGRGEDEASGNALRPLAPDGAHQIGDRSGQREAPVFLGIQRVEGDPPLAVVVDAPPVPLGQERRPEARMRLGEQFRPDLVGPGPQLGYWDRFVPDMDLEEKFGMRQVVRALS
jgi:hypothetical protein